MRHEKILKREDGSSVMITVSTWANSYGSKITWDIKIAVKGFRKRTWIYVSCGDDYRYRELNTEDRRIYQHNLFLDTVTEDEIHEAKLELWEKLKPIKETK